MNNDTIFFVFLFALIFLFWGEPDVHCMIIGDCEVSND